MPASALVMGLLTSSWSKSVSFSSWEVLRIWDKENRGEVWWERGNYRDTK